MCGDRGVCWGGAELAVSAPLFAPSLTICILPPFRLARPARPLPSLALQVSNIAADFYNGVSNVATTVDRRITGRGNEE